ncbi:hypothetical protein ACIG47_16355 [Promicromonospora sp. NPDC052451]|uniref:hypothetical protein n=1 Tax=Promicromonospora sp. NPDC052451 TaxID=3364407 RepID=UPI0037C6F133
MTDPTGTGSVPAVGGSTDRWAFVLPAGWERFPGEAGALAVYRPVTREAGSGAPVSITEVELDGVGGRSAEEVGALILSHGYAGCEPVELGGRPGVRLTSDRSVRQPSGRAVVAHQVTYVVSRDDADGAWLALTLSTAWDSTPAKALSDALVAFFDAAMGTFSWVGHGAQPRHLPPRRVPGSS